MTHTSAGTHTRPYTVVGAGAIGGTLAYALASAGHPVTVIDTDQEHVDAIRAHGLVREKDGVREGIAVEVATPGEFTQPLRRVLLAVKAQATTDALDWLAPRLEPDGYVVSVQNGFNEPLIAERVGQERTVAAFVNIFADVIEPGVIRDGGHGAFVLGHPGGGLVSARVRDLVTDLRAWGPAQASDNVEGYLWAKASFGAMLAATALADDAMADLIDRHRPAMYALAEEVLDVAAVTGTRIESFDAFEAPSFTRGTDPAVRDAACDRLTAWLRGQPKNRSGIWRDLAVRHRPVEVTTHYTTVFETADRAGLDTPVLRHVIAGMRELERDATGMAEERLATLDRIATGGVRELPGTPALTDEQAGTVHDWLREHHEEMVADLAAYTEHGSSSDDPAALEHCLNWLRGWLGDSLGAPEKEELLTREGGKSILIQRFPGRNAASTGDDSTSAVGTADGDQPVLLLCHYDTVWPTGTLLDWPFQREGDRLTGPGVFDMKAGLVQAVWALRALDALRLPRPPCTLMLNGDEETGSHASSESIVAEARTSRAAMVFEASAAGAVKTTRKGVGLFTLVVTGTEAHAGLDPEAGASAVDELAQQILRLRALDDAAAGTSVNVGVVHGGTRSNVTAGRAVAELDVRVASKAEQERVDAALAQLTPVDGRTGISVEGGWNRPVFERTAGVERMYRLARACATPIGLDLREAAVGGASDGNFVLAAGTPVLDGIGAVGAGAHARSEHATVSGMTERAALAAGVLAALAAG